MINKMVLRGTTSAISTIVLAAYYNLHAYFQFDVPSATFESLRVAFPAACGVGRLETGCLEKRRS
jgi:hypothetical protein